MIEIKTTILRQIENNNKMYRDISFLFFYICHFIHCIIILNLSQYSCFYSNYDLYIQIDTYNANQEIMNKVIRPATRLNQRLLTCWASSLAFLNNFIFKMGIFKTTI